MEHTAVQLDDEGPPVISQSELEEDVTGEIATKKEEADKASTSGSSWLAFLTLDYYQTFFDVSTKQVLSRAAAGMTPVYLILVDTLGTNPDLYGPFWLAVTLIITNAVFGNVSRFMQVGSDWEFHFAEVTSLATVVLTYIWVMPLLVWGLLWWTGSKSTYTLLQLLAIYGYSMTSFIPLSILWTINNEIVRWVSLGLGCALSGGVLGRSLWKALSQENRKQVALIVLVILLLLHFGLTVGIKFLLFPSFKSYKIEDATTSFTNSSQMNQ